ncbi:MAG: CAP domain-containing protein [Vicinamibacterales bacterium]
MLRTLNQVRHDARRPPLARLPVLDAMAQAHSVDMACRDYFDHVTPERRRPKDRLKAMAGRSAPDWDRLAEVIGTSGTAARQVSRWLGSRAHKRAVLDGAHELVGIGLVRIDHGSHYTTYWTVELMHEHDADP